MNDNIVRTEEIVIHIFPSIYPYRKKSTFVRQKCHTSTKWINNVILMIDITCIIINN